MGSFGWFDVFFFSGALLSPPDEIASFPHTKLHQQHVNINTPATFWWIYLGVFVFSILLPSSRLLWGNREREFSDCIRINVCKHKQNALTHEHTNTNGWARAWNMSQPVWLRLNGKKCHWSHINRRLNCGRDVVESFLQIYSHTHRRFSLDWHQIIYPSI